MKKRIIIIFCLLFLCSCGKNKQHPDFVTSNTGGRMFSPIISSGSGYYYNDGILMKLSLKYYDVASGKSIFLCSRPECTHDGNEFCNATSDKYRVQGMSEYEDNIYIEVLEINDDKTESVYKLLRAKKDGTELSEVASFAKQHTDAPWELMSQPFDNPVIHRGKAYVSYRLARDESITTWGIAEIDIYSGTVKTVFEELSNGNVYSISASGDDLFFILFSRGEYDNGWYLYHYNIRSGKLQSVASTERFVYSGTAYKGKYIYTAYISYADKVHGDQYGVFSYDPETDEVAFWDNEISTFYEGDVAEARLKYDGKYWYAYKVIRNNENYRFALFSDTFEKLAEADIPKEESDFSMDILDSTVYLQYYSHVLKCPTEDIINGNIHWDEAFRIERETDKYEG